MAPVDPRETLLRMVEGRSDLDGNFNRIERIGGSGGDGNFSLVFKAIQISTGKEVALKFYHPLMRTSEFAYRLECFRREAGILQELSEQNDIISCVAPISEFTISLPTQAGIDRKIQFSYYALELAENDVTTAIEFREWNPEANLIAFSSMCRAVQRLHKHEICHRDLKPRAFR